jgi:hypothetical protein
VVHSLFTSSKASFRSPCPDEGVWAYVGWGGSAVRGWAVIWELTSTAGSFARLPRRGRLGLRGLGWIGGSWLAVTGAIQTQRGKLVPE